MAPAWDKVQTAVDKREVDRTSMVNAFAGAAICNLVLRVEGRFKDYQEKICFKIDNYFGARIIRGEFPQLSSVGPIMPRHSYEPPLCLAKALLDVPTSADIPTLAKLSHFRDGASSPWNLINSLISICLISIQLVSQLWMLLHLLKNQPDSSWLVIGSFVGPVVQWLQHNHGFCESAEMPRALVVTTIAKAVLYSVRHHGPR